MTTINKILEKSKIEILHDPDFASKSNYQHLKLWCMANANIFKVMRYSLVRDFYLVSLLIVAL